MKINKYKKDLKNYDDRLKLLHYKKRVKCDTFYKYYLKRKAPIFIPQFLNYVKKQKKNIQQL